MKKVQQGFTLIELLIVVAIIGILAAIAIPQYQDYLTRSKWQGAVTSVESLKIAIAECTQNNAGNTANCVGYGGNGTAATPGNGLAGAPVMPGAPDFTFVDPVATGANGVTMIINGLAQVASCQVTIVGQTGATNTVASEQMLWTYTTTDGVCTKRQTGYDVAAG